ncbi:MAG: alkylhydroperoxidase-related (seleno)protein [Gammaproteobacteria bacterium]|nr:alkylhydroperoxidase-related (seleno)protein [Gammaproteobacteria bacterium]
MYEGNQYPLRDYLKDNHVAAWESISKSGPFWTGADRVAMAKESRLALECELCKQRKVALSPNMVGGTHDSDSHLPLVIIDAIHRLVSDPARYTKSVFDRVIESGITVEQYVEMVGVVSATVIIDGTHRAVSQALPMLPEGEEEPPLGQTPTMTVEDGAWVPLAPRDNQVNSVGIPNSANILRSMGSVPDAVELFFRVFRSHYLVVGSPIDLPRSQMEYIAARVSAVNECFY